MRIILLIFVQTLSMSKTLSIIQHMHQTQDLISSITITSSLLPEKGKVMIGDLELCDFVRLVILHQILDTQSLWIEA